MNKYTTYTPEQLEELFSNYLIDSWSYSGVTTFARNEKAFEMTYIYREKEKRSVSSVSGNAYHEALKQYFLAMMNVQDNIDVPVVDLYQTAFDYIDAVQPGSWRLSDKFNTVEAASLAATARVNKLLSNFAAEVSVYSENISQVLEVEGKHISWVVVNGVDIPLPLHAILDLVVRTKDNKVVIIDHKSKDKLTPPDEVALVHGQQAVTYAKAWEADHPEDEVAEVWFIENKSTENKDKSPQLVKHIITLDRDSRRLYEALLYEPLRRMLEACSDPDYIFTINKDDNFVDKATIYDFWARTQISEIEDWPDIPVEKRELLEKRQRKIKDSSIGCISPKIISEFRKNASQFIAFDYSKTNMTQSEKIEHILRTFGVKVQVAHVIEGFSCDTYLCELAPGTEVLAVFRHALDIAYALDVPKVRVDGVLVMYEGKSYVGIEVNKKRTETLLWDKSFVEGHKLPIGQDNFRRTIYWDLDNHATPHMLACGSTGSGKSVLLRTLIQDAVTAKVEEIIILDPKYDFIIDAPEEATVLCEIPEIEAKMAELVEEMNNRIRERRKKLTLVVFDEFADANDQARTPKELALGEKTLQENFKMLLQKGRSCGFRFVAATQRADTKTINGTIKVNFPVLCCFRVPKGLDSKVVLDTEGAETLAGYGDGLLRSPEYQDHLVRFQGFYYNS